MKRWLAALALVLAPAISADAAIDQTIALRAGEARLLPLLTPPARLYLDQPDLATLKTPQPNQVLILAEQPGHTVLHALASDGAPIATIAIDIGATQDPAADDAAPLRPVTIALQPLQVQRLPLAAAASRLFVNDPDIVAASMLGPEQVLLRGKANGSTLVYALDDAGERVGLYAVTVGGTAADAPAVAKPATVERITDRLDLAAAEARLIDLPRPASTASADDPRIAETRLQPPAKLLVIGKEAGRTLVHATDGTGQAVALVVVTVSGTAE